MSCVATYVDLRHIETGLNKFHVKILERLVFNSNPTVSTYKEGMTRYALSRPKAMQNRDISQSAILKYTEDLLRRDLIVELSKSTIEGGKFRIEYDITTLGLLRWFGYLNNLQSTRVYNDKKVTELIDKCKQLLPWVSGNWEYLKKNYSGEFLFRKLLRVSDRVSLENDNDPVMLTHRIVGHVPLGDSELLVDDYVQSFMQTENFEHRVAKLNEKISQVLSFLFIHEILLPVTPINYEKGFRQEKKRFDKILSVVKGDLQFFEIYKKYLEQLKNHYLLVEKFLNAEVLSLKTSWKKVKGRYRLK